MSVEGMTPSQEEALREIAQKSADQDHDADMVASQLRLYAVEWNIHYLETQIIQMAEEAVATRKDRMATTKAGTNARWAERKTSDRRKGERRKGERRQGDRRKRERRRTGLAALAAKLLRFGKSERRRGDRRSGADRRQSERRQTIRRHIVRRRTER